VQELVPPKATARKDRRTKDGFTYRCDATVAIPGRPSVRVTATGASRRDAKQNWLLRAERMRSGLVRAEMPLPDYLDSWLRVHEGKARPTTIARYRSDVQKYLKPKFKGYTLDQITYDMVEEYVAELRKGGLREKTVRHIVSTLSSAMSAAFKRRLIPMNPARDIHVVKDENPRIPEWVAPPVMLDLLLMEPESPQRDLLIVLTVLPLRLNEARGIQYLDLQQGYTYLDLREAVSKDPNATRRTLKTSQSQRGIHLPLPVQAVVQRALTRRGDGPVEWFGLLQPCPHVASLRANRGARSRGPIPQRRGCFAKVARHWPVHRSGHCFIVFRSSGVHHGRQCAAGAYALVGLW